MNMKYEILKFDTMEVDFHRVYRIKNVNTGELGGYIENEDNLSQEGNCWVHRNAIVYGRARVRDNAQIMDCAKVCGQNVCLDFGDVIVYDNARVREKAKVSDNAKIFHNADVFGEAIVHGRAEVSENAQVFDKSEVYGWVKVKGNSKICGRTNINSDSEVIDTILKDCNITGAGKIVMKSVELVGIKIDYSSGTIKNLESNPF